jgi:hypothetical protein
LDPITAWKRFGSTSTIAASRGWYPKAQAEKLANSYNVFAKAEAERTNRLLTNEARVESNRGSFHLYFPTIKSPEVRRAMKAASWSLRPFRF